MYNEEEGRDDQAGRTLYTWLSRGWLVRWSSGDDAIDGFPKEGKKLLLHRNSILLRTYADVMMSLIHFPWPGWNWLRHTYCFLLMLQLDQGAGGEVPSACSGRRSLAVLLKPLSIHIDVPRAKMGLGLLEYRRSS
jgi:hypothetical protein